MLAHEEFLELLEKAESYDDLIHWHKTITTIKATGGGNYESSSSNIMRNWNRSYLYGSGSYYEVCKREVTSVRSRSRGLSDWKTS